VVSATNISGTKRTDQHHGTKEARLDRTERVLKQLATMIFGEDPGQHSENLNHGQILRTVSNTQTGAITTRRTRLERRNACTWNRGKPQQTPVNAACGNDGSTSRRIFVTDLSTKTSFLVDTSADVCVYPQRKIQRYLRKNDYELFDVNRMTIATYSTILLFLNLCL
jgi:hypothetical protein